MKRIIRIFTNLIRKYSFNLCHSCSKLQKIYPQIIWIYTDFNNFLTKYIFLFACGLSTLGILLYLLPETKFQDFYKNINSQPGYL